MLVKNLKLVAYGQEGRNVVGGVSFRRVCYYITCVTYLGDSGKARGCFTNTSVIDSFTKKLIQSWFVKISIRRRHARMVEDGAFIHKIDYVTIFKERALLVQK